MAIQHEAIFQKALGSSNPTAVFEVARAFEAIGVVDKARPLYQHARSLFSFGAMARGTPIPNTNGAVIPPGRYWQDIIGEPAKKAWSEWIKGKPEVHVETTEDHIDDNRLFVIFTIPTNANNYGKAGVFFPTKVLGFPSIAPSNITSSQDTVQRPDPVTSSDVLAEMAKTAGKTTKSFGEGLGVTPTTLALIGGGLLIALLLASRIMSPIRL